MPLSVLSPLPDAQQQNLSPLYPAFCCFPAFAAPHLVVAAHCLEEGLKSSLWTKLKAVLEAVQTQQDPPDVQ